MGRIDAPYIDQSGRYPTGCESVSSVMLLQFLGCPVTVDEFIENDLKRKAFEERDGQLFGPDPWNCFCGSPYDDESFGCYAPVICEALNHYFSRTGNTQYEAVDETGTSMEELRRKYIDAGMPVVFWAAINMREPIIGPSWRLLETGEEFTWISNEHCMLLVGYDEEGYWFNDPYENNGVIRYPKEVTEDRHRVQYSMAVGVKKRRIYN